MKQWFVAVKLFYSCKSVKITYILVSFFTFLLEYLFELDRNYFLIAPGLAAQSMFGSLYGIITVFLTGKVWEQDLMDGTVKNIVSAGTCRRTWLVGKIGVMIIHNMCFTSVISAVGICVGLMKKSDLSFMSSGGIVRINLLSFATVFLISMVYSVLAMSIFLSVRNFRYSLVAAIAVAFFECIAGMMYTVDLEMVLSPFGFMVKAVNALAKYDINALGATVRKGVVTMIAYIAVFGSAGFSVGLKRDY